jgi:hypothetical protein
MNAQKLGKFYDPLIDRQIEEICAALSPAKKGTTAARPASLVTSDAGYLYFDTTLATDGKPIWWTGAAWVDSAGTIV